MTGHMKWETLVKKYLTPEQIAEARKWTEREIAKIEAREKKRRAKRKRARRARR